MTRMGCKTEQWYEEKARNLPWRETSDPYLIWVSEIILQQTRVAQGLPFYYNFITKFPSVKSLAEASEDEVLKIWQGLGYYSRARNMMKAAQIILKEYKGSFPDSIEELKKIPGIGNYTAAAIGSFAFNIRIPAIDGNVRRVASRLYGLHEPIGTPNSDKKIEALLLNEMQPCPPALFNQAMMEIGATVCKPANPECTQCPYEDVCVARIKNLQKILPVKSVKKAPREVYLDYLFINAEGFTWLQKRTTDSIWKGLYEFPNIQNTKNSKDVNPFQDWFVNNEDTQMHKPFTIKHQLTHQTIFATLWQFSCKEANIVEEKIQDKLRLKLSEIHAFPAHRLMLKFLEKVI
ncbi:MAG: A/G-specific adenine glycosylase [Bacteroidetes bacterium]|nr:A/G-specific adenine glycosylase [Bacteroidota bacterium]